MASLRLPRFARLRGQGDATGASAASGFDVRGGQQAEDARILRQTRLRLMAVSGLVTFVILLVLGFVLYGVVANRFTASDQSQLEHFAAEFHRNAPPDTGAPLQLSGANAGLFAIFIAPNGQTIPQGGIETLPTGLPNQAGIQAAQASSSGTNYRSFVAPDGTSYDVYTETDQTIVYRALGQALSGFTIQYVANRTQEAALLGTLRLILLGGGLAALLAALLAGYLYAGRALVPIRASMERRRAALQRQREFTANASHELRTPLTVIRASVTDLLRNRRSRVEDVGEALGDIDAEVKHLTALVDDLLLLARTDSGVVQVEHVQLDVADLAVEASSTLNPLAEERSIRIEAEPVPAMISGDPLRLRQLVTILVDNAIRHSPTGSTVRVRVRPDGEGAALAVEDQGPGIRPEDMPRLFERFWRADDAPAGGTGLGLSIAKWIVEQHAGTIGATNLEGGGARFWVRLPGAQAGQNEAEAAPVPGPGADTAAGPNGSVADMDDPDGELDWIARLEARVATNGTAEREASGAGSGAPSGAAAGDGADPGQAGPREAARTEG